MSHLVRTSTTELMNCRAGAVKSPVMVAGQRAGNTQRLVKANAKPRARVCYPFEQRQYDA
jgi:hypothetical protein